MTRTKIPTGFNTGRPSLKRSGFDHEATDGKRVKAAQPSDSGPLDPTLLETAVQSSEPKAEFLVQPPNAVDAGARLRPFVVMASGIPADTLEQSLAPYRATITIFYDNSDIQILDPSPVVDHTNHWMQSYGQYPGQEGTKRIVFIFDNVKIDYLGEYTMFVSIFRPGDDIEGEVYLRTPCSTLVLVASLSRRIQPIPPSLFDDRVYAELGIGPGHAHHGRQDSSRESQVTLPTGTEH
ncbi:hypothetical protein C8A00DRAFT_36480 [Chaetomidium leptoderma]|uniref:Uncharacterized protein n=1 Tax=Chaetomidium leptoderma TaxID=669021 RepID=A0AAN6VGY5_9PEZI|nr:hypothetical protein C8A00DRAFT_36480 [Chaetomidium leptoderma]